MLLTDEFLLQYKRCHRRAFLNVYGENHQKLSEKDFISKLRKERESHSWNVLQSYNLPYQQPKTLTDDTDNYLTLGAITENLMRQGVECIYQGVIYHSIPNFLDEEKEVILIASPTLLIRQDIPSRWGNWSYFSVNTYFGKNIKPEYKLISAFQGDILNYCQNINFSEVKIVLRNNKKSYFVNLNEWIPIAKQLVNECILMLTKKKEPDIFISRQRCSICQWYNSCYPMAKSQQNLSLIPGINPKRQELLANHGIHNLTTLSQANLSDLQLLLDHKIAVNIYYQTQSIISQKPILKNNNLPNIPTGIIEIYFDIEAEPDQNIDYLLGILLINNDTKEKKYYTFLAENISEEAKIWHEFLDLINLYHSAPIFHYSPYEVETIKRLAYLYKTPSSQLYSLLIRLFDLHKFITNYFYLPVENYSLKSVAHWLGFWWRNPLTPSTSIHHNSIGGDQCVFWYDQWLQTGDRKWLEYILIYNEDDCLATYELKKWLNKY